MKEEFKSELIGIDHDNLEKEKDRFEQAILYLRDISVQWKQVIKKPITPEKTKELLESNNLQRVIEESYVYSLDNELSRLAKKGQYKIDVLIAGTPFPPFDNLLDTVERLRQFINENSALYITAHLQEFFDNQFNLPAKFLKEIEARHTYYTANIFENFILTKIRELCNIINVFNNVGANIVARDLPNNLGACITTVKGKKKFSDINGAHNSSPNYYLPKLVPYWGMFRRNNPLLHHIQNNPTEIDINE